MFFEASKSVSGMTGVRLSYGLGAWAELGELYPPALEALQALAEKLKKQLWEGEGDFDVMAEYSSINQYLGDAQATVRVFRHVAQHYPKQASRQFFAVQDVLFTAHEYELISQFIDDPIYAFEQARNNREYMLSRVRQGKEHRKTDYADAEYRKRIEELMALTEKLQQDDINREIQKRHDAYMALAPLD